MNTWKSKNRKKYLLQYHIIFVCKYRKKLFISKQILDVIEQFSYKICQKHKVIIRYKVIRHIIFGRSIQIIYKNNSGENRHFGQMDILLVV